MKQPIKNNRPISRELERFQSEIKTPISRNMPFASRPKGVEDNFQRVQHPYYQARQASPRSANRKGNPLDSVHDNQQIKVELGDNPFHHNVAQSKDLFRNFDNLHIATEEDDHPLEIKVFPNSTKTRLEKQQNKVAQSPIIFAPKVQPPQFQHQHEKLHNYQITHQDCSQRSTPAKMDLQLESKLFPDRGQRTNSNISKQMIEQQNLNQYTPRCKMTPSDSIVQIKLHRSLDKHFYEFIKEYGVIIQPETPHSDRSTEALGQSEYNLMISNLPSENFSSEKRVQAANPSFQKPDSGVFSQYFQQLGKPPTQTNVFKPQPTSIPQPQFNKIQPKHRYS